MKKTMDYVTVAAGILLLCGGLVLLRTGLVDQTSLYALPYVCIGLGCGLFGHGIANVISRRMLKNSPELLYQNEIEKNDERNIYIACKAKAKAYDMMIFVFGALMVSFALMNIDLAAVLLLVCAYLFVVGNGIYYRCRFEKEM